MKSLLLAVAIASLGVQDKAPRAIDLLEDAGHQYEKSGTGWAVHFEGTNQKQIRVFLVQVEGLIVLGSILATKADIADPAGLHEALLVASDDIDYVKTVIDNDGDYALRTDLLAAGLNGKRFSDQLMQIARAADQLRPVVDKFRKK
jgi:hypothetical protein